jgi:hypothetical protein
MFYLLGLPGLHLKVIFSTPTPEKLASSGETPGKRVMGAQAYI